MSEPAASVVIPAFRAADTIAAVLRGLQGQDLAERFEIIVVASGGDTTAAIARQTCPRATVVEVDVRLAPGAARNLGVAHSRGDVVAFLAADCVPDPSWLRRRVEAHRAGHPLVSGFVDMATPTTLAGFAQYLAKFWGMLAYERRTMVGPGPLFHLSYLRRVLDEFGPFLEAPIAGEDTAYNDRLVRAGHRVYFDGAIRVQHVNDTRFADVLAAQREQGAATGALCRDAVIARVLRAVGTGRLAPARAHDGARRDHRREVPAPLVRALPPRRAARAARRSPRGGARSAVRSAAATRR